MNKTVPFLPYARQAIDKKDIDAVVDVLSSDFLTTGPATEAFEEKLADVMGARFAVSCSSGTAALHLAAFVLDLGPADSVVVPSITFLATANAPRYVGAEVVFADVDAETGLMGPEQLEQAFDRGGSSIKAVFPVHLGGQSPAMGAISEIARARGAVVVEDACHALGSFYPGKKGAVSVGSCADSHMAAFSFHPIKTITMGEGGAITTNDAALYESLKRVRNHGMTRDGAHFTNADMAFDADGAVNPWYYEMEEPGFNYRASNIHCALGLSQLEKLEHFVETRRNLVALYDQMIEPLAPVIRPLGRSPGCHPGWHLYVTLIDFEAAGVSRALVMNRLRDQGIGTQVHYIPVHLQPYYRDRYAKIDLPGANAYYQRCLTLPLHPGMGERDVERVVNAIADVLGL